MLRNVNILDKSKVNAIDGEIGNVEDIYFDDLAWAVRYLTVDTGTWLTRREVLISPYSVVPPLVGNAINVSLTRDQVKDSPDIDTHKPVSRQHEREYLGYYGYPTYWNTGGLWAMGGYPIVPPEALSHYDDRHEQLESEVKPEDAHLRSIKNVRGYFIEASDGSIGHIDDFIFDVESWAIRYVLVDTSSWWQGSKKVLIATTWIERIDWLDSRAFTTLTREAIKKSPPYDVSAILDREFETRLHDTYARQGYWNSK
ncbi:MAG: PRC-barrel domain-containing protein [Massilia sp.]